MIRKFENNDLAAIMQIWLNVNIQAHSFIDQEYWKGNFEQVSTLLPQAEIYVYENNQTAQIEGFVGLSQDYIEGIFVKPESQSNGIGKQLLNYVKAIKNQLRLSVYAMNQRAIQFYRREQFSIQSEHMDQNTKEREYVMIWHAQTSYEEGKRKTSL